MISNESGAHGRIVKVLDLGSRGLGFDSPGVLVMCQSLGQDLNLYHFHPAVMGTRWNENWYCVNFFSCRKCTVSSPEK